MARTTSVINQQILDSITADTTLAPLLTSTSKRAIYRLFAFIVAVAINFLEQLMDIFTLNVETVAATAAPGTPAWLQAQLFKFQYSDTSPQVIQFINYAPAYPTVDPTLCIISRASVNTTVANQVEIKVATGSTPAALTSTQLDALKAYINPPNGIGTTGITYNVSSSNSDKLYVQATIYYSGDYAAVIQANVIAAINNFLAVQSDVNHFNGKMKLSDLELAVRNVAGVNDVVMVNVQARPDAVAYGSGTYLIQAQQVLSRLWSTVSGYIVSETVTGHTLADSLTFIAE
jgi:hypothetical protein